MAIDCDKDALPDRMDGGPHRCRRMTTSFLLMHVITYSKRVSHCRLYLHIVAHQVNGWIVY